MGTAYSTADLIGPTTSSARSASLSFNNGDGTGRCDDREDRRQRRRGGVGVDGHEASRDARIDELQGHGTRRGMKVVNDR